MLQWQWKIKRKLYTLTSYFLKQPAIPGQLKCKAAIHVLQIPYLNFSLSYSIKEQ